MPEPTRKEGKSYQLLTLMANGQLQSLDTIKKDRFEPGVNGEQKPIF